MKQTVRLNTFETNSSSTHSLILVNTEIFDKFKNKELYFSISEESFIDKTKIPELEEFESDYSDYNELSEEDKLDSIEEFIDNYTDCDYPVLATYNSLDLCTKEVYDKDGNKQIAFSYYING